MIWMIFIEILMTAIQIKNAKYRSYLMTFGDDGMLNNKNFSQW